MISMEQKNKSYAQVAQQALFPTKDQAIVIDAVEGIPIQEYTVAISKITDSKNIRFVSRISHGRVCLYLNTKENADKLTDLHSKVVIGKHSLEIRPLISKAKRIIMSNVCPCIPHEVIQTELTKQNIRLSSQISFIRAGYSDPGFCHILSFRRTCYIHPEDVVNLPEVLQISYDSSNYWIYLSTDKLTCFLCKEEGHLAKFCKNTDTSAQKLKNTPLGQDPMVLSNIVTVNTNENQTEDNVSLSQEKCVQQCMPPPSVKRPLPSTSSTNDTISGLSGNTHNKGYPDLGKKVIKKPRKSMKSEITKQDVIIQLQPAKDKIIDNMDKYQINFDNMTDYLYTCYDNPNILDNALRYTKDISALTDLLSVVKDLLTERKIKSRIVRIIKKLVNTDFIEDTSSDSCSPEGQEV